MVRLADCTHSSAPSSTGEEHPGYRPGAHPVSVTGGRVPAGCCLSEVAPALLTTAGGVVHNLA